MCIPIALVADGLYRLADTVIARDAPVFTLLLKEPDRKREAEVDELDPRLPVEANAILDEPCNEVAVAVDRVSGCFDASGHFDRTPLQRPPKPGNRPIENTG